MNNIHKQCALSLLAFAAAFAFHLITDGVWGVFTAFAAVFCLFIVGQGIAGIREAVRSKAQRKSMAIPEQERLWQHYTFLIRHVRFAMVALYDDLDVPSRMRWISLISELERTLEAAYAARACAKSPEEQRAFHTLLQEAFAHVKRRVQQETETQTTDTWSTRNRKFIAALKEHYTTSDSNLARVISSLD